LLPLLTMLQKSLQDENGSGWACQLQRLLRLPHLGRTIGNTLWLGVLITALVVTIAFGYAYALTRTCMPGKGLSPHRPDPALMPSRCPPSAWSTGLAIRDRQRLLGGESIYGPIGIVIGLGFWCFPHALMILILALGQSDARLYEASRVLGSSGWRTFVTVTLPTARYGLLSAAIAVFTSPSATSGWPR
jgi:iron(III) transport system permease protein